MKKILLAGCLFTVGSAFAQPKMVSQAIINTTTTIVAPDESDDVSNVQIQGGDGNRMSFRNFGDGETKSVVYLKNDMVKTVIKSDMGRSTIIRDNAAKKTTTLLEIMGNKTGFYATDEEAEQMRHRMDSMMQATRNAADTGRRMARPSGETPVEIAYTEDTKKIAGYVCKKAYLISTRLLGVKDSIAVWYTPDIKLNNVSNTGGTFSFGNMMGGGSNALASLSKIDGFPMSYQTRMPRGRTMTVEVTKIDINKEIADKEFDIPKDFDVKPMSEMRNMMQMGGRQGAVGGQRVIIGGN